MVGGLFRLLSPTERFQRDAEGFARFVSHRIEEVWDQPEARDRFVGQLHDDLSLDATLYDTEGPFATSTTTALANPILD